MTFIKHTLPSANRNLRQEIYEGNIFIIPASQASKQLVEYVTELVQESFGLDFQRAQFELPFSYLLEKGARIRKRILANKGHHELLRRVIAETGFDVEANAIDPLRLRTVLHGGHKYPRSGPGYIPHRDTWFASPQAQINWWIPLHDASEEQTFSIYPEYFNKPVPNSSCEFNYDQWAKNVGFGNSYGNVVQASSYPTVRGQILDEGKALRFSARKGDVVLFSGAHLHRTNFNESWLTRFSVDFRTVNLGDNENGIGAPNADNSSCGSALVDFVEPSLSGGK